ncbi:serine hydrolase domain-containing protein [Brevibacillus choshinensis]|uniref:serine hydrolase domain-containing protein n=1 Tax=Brevibacillus choshinensis TaxID=54911 RepID=UPI002E1AEAF6|nr:serine hydrolase [Brevibacillus choshinensis]
MTIKSALEEYLKCYEERGYFSGSLLIARNKEILLQKAIGYANLEHNTLNTTKTKFRIGSITKSFTAMAILLLCQKGVLHLEDPINLHLDGLASGDKVTIHHLLTHTSGIPNFTSFPDYWSTTMRMPSTLPEIIRSFAQLPLDFTPGTRYHYSNSGYILLTAIIEKASCTSYANYLRENIWAPLGMVDTGCEEHRSVIKGLATGYTAWEEIIHTEYMDMTIPRGAYGMYSTVEDLWKWDQALYTEKLIDAEWLAKMFEPYQFGYGYGWAVDQQAGKKVISHFGDINGFHCDMYRVVDDQLVVIALSNVNLTPVTKLTRDLAKITAGEELHQPLSLISSFLKETPEAINRSVGTYVDSTDERMKVEITEEPHGIFVTHPKMYGVPYKFRLHLVAQSEESIEWITGIVYETFKVHLQADQSIRKLTFTDEYGKIYRLTLSATAKRS